VVLQRHLNKRDSQRHCGADAEESWEKIASYSGGVRRAKHRNHWGRTLGGRVRLEKCEPAIAAHAVAVRRDYDRDYDRDYRLSSLVSVRPR